MKTYTGGCHCKQVRYEVALDLEKPVIECNCSHCAVKGLLLAFVPKTEFILTSGEEHLTEYRFNTEKIAHLFCSNCGVESFGYGQMPDGTPTAAINVRTVDDVELDALTRQPYDGKNR